MPRSTNNSNKPTLGHPNNIPISKTPTTKQKTSVAQPVLLRNKALLGRTSSDPPVVLKTYCPAASSSSLYSPEDSTISDPNSSTVAPLHPDMDPTNLDLERELGIDISSLSQENRKLVQVLLKGMNTLVEKQIASIKLENEKEIQSLNKQIITLEEKLDDLDNYGRRNTIIISGRDVPRVVTDENCVNTAVECIRNRLGVEIFPNDIDIAHRLGRPQAASEDRRSMIVKLTRRENKHKIYTACSLKKPTNLFFSDSVSRTRSTIMYVLRKARKDYPRVFERYRTEDGNVRVFMPRPGLQDGVEKITVNTRRQLEELLRTKVNVDSSRWQVEWK